MSAMADAVENSEFVIMCMSDSYKQSAYCQAEAEYAFKCRRRLLPLVMRQGYKPDGWLGFMMGSRIYVDFGRFDFETACEKLMNEITLQRTQQVPSILINTLPTHGSMETPSEKVRSEGRTTKTLAERNQRRSETNKDMLKAVLKVGKVRLDFCGKPIHQWTDNDVSDFLRFQRLNSLVPLCESMNGRALLQLYKMCIGRSLRAYSVLKEELKSGHGVKLSISDYSRFLSTIEEVLSSSFLKPPSSFSVPVPQQLTPAMLVNSMPFKPAPSLGMSYDFSTTSDASPQEALRMVEHFSTELQLLDRLRRRMARAS